jgi:hypothetical protein
MLEPPHETTDGEHGRIEQRRHVVCHKVDWLFSDRRYTDEPRFPHLSMIGMVESRVERNGVLARERRYYLSSTKLDAKGFAAAVRAHWGVENRLHWVLATSCSTTISPGCEAATDRKTWLSSNTWR